jgi:acyl carrier protein
MQMKDLSCLELEIAQIVSEITGETVGVEATRDSVPSWDSLRHVEVIFAFEEAYGITLEEAEMADLKTVKSLARRVASAR